MEASVTHEGSPSVAVIAIAGDLDMNASEKMRALCDDAIRTSPGGVVIDLAGVTFLDSAGVETLVRAGRIAGQAGVTLAIVGPPDTYVAAKFARMGVLSARVLPLAEDRSAALAIVRQGA